MARRFRFRLQRVLRVSELREAAGRERLQVAAAARRGEERRLDGLRRRLDDWRGRFRDGWTAAPPAGEVAARADGLHRLAGERDRQRLRLQAASREEQARHAELVALWQRREVLARLRKRRFIEHRWDYLREEQRFLDDIGGRGKPALASRDAERR